MEIIDCHVHQGDIADVDKATQWFQTTRLDAAHVFSVSPRKSESDARGSVEVLAELAQAMPEKIIPLVRVDPLADNAVQFAKWAIKEKGMVGIKMLPNGWYPDGPEPKDIYKLAEDLAVPIQFHSGILWMSNDCSKYNRPAYWEAMLDFAGVRFSLAHISWPWTDECIAVVGKFRATNTKDESRDDCQAWIDLTPGTPAIYRRDALERCLACVGADLMIYGSDATFSGPEGQRVRWTGDEKRFGELGCSAEDIQNIFAGNARRFLRRA